MLHICIPVSVVFASASYPRYLVLANYGFDLQTPNYFIGSRVNECVTTFVILILGLKLLAWDNGATASMARTLRLA